jgi:hypothetical protein
MQDGLRPREESGEGSPHSKGGTSGPAARIEWHTPGAPDPAKRTQAPPRSGRQRHRGSPRFDPAERTQFHDRFRDSESICTNFPFSVRPGPGRARALRNEPNPRRDRDGKDVGNRSGSILPNEPNFRTDLMNHQELAPISKTPPALVRSTPELCETNPVPPATDSAKRTQFPPRRSRETNPTEGRSRAIRAQPVREERPHPDVNASQCGSATWRGVAGYHKLN